MFLPPTHTYPDAYGSLSTSGYSNLLHVSSPSPSGDLLTTVKTAISGFNDNNHGLNEGKLYAPLIGSGCRGWEPEIAAEVFVRGVEEGMVCTGEGGDVVVAVKDGDVAERVRGIFC